MINKSWNAGNISPNIGLSIDVRVTQRPCLYQCPIYQPDQLILPTLPHTADRVKKTRSGADISNFISVDP